MCASESTRVGRQAGLRRIGLCYSNVSCPGAPMLSNREADQPTVLFASQIVGVSACFQIGQASGVDRAPPMRVVVKIGRDLLQEPKSIR